MRIDGHQHFWTLQRDDYTWLTPDLKALYRDFLPDDLQPLLIQANVDHTILVQAAATTDETRYLLEIAKRQPIVAGVVGWVDMNSPEGAINTLDEFTCHSKFVGIRPMIQEVNDPAWINQPKIGVVLNSLIERDLCFDALVRSAHLPYLLKCLTRHPDLRAVVDHGAKPNIANGEWQPWADSIAAIASQTSAYCKVSGLITEVSDMQTYDDTMPYLTHLLDIFGPERLIWGSDWPVLNLAGDYKSWHDAAINRLVVLSEADQNRIFGSNAIEFYGLKK